MSGGQGERIQSAEYLLHLLYTSYGDTAILSINHCKRVMQIHLKFIRLIQFPKSSLTSLNFQHQEGGRLAHEESSQTKKHGSLAIFMRIDVEDLDTAPCPLAFPPPPSTSAGIQNWSTIKKKRPRPTDKTKSGRSFVNWRLSLEGNCPNGPIAKIDQKLIS